MSIRLAASKPIARLRADPRKLQQMRLTCSNDNSQAQIPAPQGEDIFQAALRLFAVHGLAAARQASDQALAARAAGDAAEFGRWRDICRTLDRTLARRLDHGAAAQGKSLSPR